VLVARYAKFRDVPLLFRLFPDVVGQLFTVADRDNCGGSFADSRFLLRLNFQEFEHGFQYQRIREGQSEADELWTVGRVSLWPHGFYLGTHFEWRVPVDDDSCLSICWFYQHVPQEREPFHQEKIPYWYAPLKDELTGRWITSHVVNQDFVGWVGQGSVADRTLEHLGESDRGVIMLRRRLLEEARKVEQGLDPKGLVRDPAQNACILLPTIGLEAARTGRPMNEFMQAQQRFRQPGRKLGELPFFAHQPEAIRQQWLNAMGLEDSDSPGQNVRTEPVPQRA